MDGSFVWGAWEASVWGSRMFGLERLVSYQLCPQPLRKRPDGRWQTRVDRGAELKKEDEGEKSRMMQAGLRQSAQFSDGQPQQTAATSNTIRSPCPSAEALTTRVW